MSPNFPTGRYAGKQVTLINSGSPYLFATLIKRFQRSSTLSRRDRFKYSKRSCSIAYMMGCGGTSPQGTSNARHVASLAGLHSRGVYCNSCDSVNGYFHHVINVRLATDSRGIIGFLLSAGQAGKPSSLSPATLKGKLT